MKGISTHGITVNSILGQSKIWPTCYQLLFADMICHNCDICAAAEKRWEQSHNILGDLRYITASGGWKKNYYGTLQIFF